MRADTHARLTLIVALLVGLVPVQAWQQGEIDTATLALRLVTALLVTWSVLLVVRRVLTTYRSAVPVPTPRRRTQDHP